MRRALASLLIIGGSLLGWTAAVDAATVVDTGWWDRNGDALLPQIDPPPEGAIRVANDPAGTAAVAAVRFELGEDESDPMLILRVVGDPAPEGSSFVACPATSEWTGAFGEPLSEAPEADCEAAAALGLVAGDGTMVSFDLAQVARAATVDIVISPSPTGESPVTDTFTVDFEAPTAADITTRGPATAGPAIPPGGSFSGDGGGAAAPPIAGGTAPGGSSPSFSPAPSSGGFDAPASPSVTVPAAGTPPTTTPGATSPVTTAIDAEQAVAPPLAGTTSSSKRWIGLVTAAAIIALGAYLWRADRARAVVTARPTIGGLGPFVRERTGPAPDVA